MTYPSRLAALLFAAASIVPLSVLAETPLVEAQSRVALASLQGGVAKALNAGRMDPAVAACVQALPPSSFHAVIRKLVENAFEQDWDRMVNTFLESPVGQKHAKRAWLRVYRNLQLPLPEPMPEFDAEDKQQLEMFSSLTDVQRYLKEDFLSGPDASPAISGRVRDLVQGCAASVKAANPAPASASPGTATSGALPAGSPTTESRDASMAAVATANDIIRRIGQECLSLLNRPETPKDLFVAWQKRNQVFVNAAAKYEAARMAEARAQGGKAQADQVWQQMTGAIRGNSQAAVRSMLDKPDRPAACQRALDVVQAGGFDIKPELPMYGEIQSLVAWAAGRP